MTMRIGILARVAAAFVLAAAAGAALAQAYPTKPIRVVVPFAPGGTSDVLARLFGPKLQASMGQPVIVENRPGASGNIGAELVAKSPPDGYTLVLMDVGNLTITPSVLTVPFDILKDFAPVTIIMYSPHLLAVNPSLPVNSAADLVKYAKANPGKLNYGSTGLGSAPHLAGVLFAQGQGLTWVDIPAKGGADSILHVMSGQADVLFNGMVATLPHVKSGKLKLLAVSSDRRVAGLPDAPTVAEATGMRDFKTGTYQGVLAPAGTPAPIVAKLHAEIARAAALPDIKEKLDALGAEPLLNTPAQFADWMKSESAKWAGVVKKANLKIQ
jgi:tripartite-type tricarboxylate transporter receptor subunit TctC